MKTEKQIEQKLKNEVKKLGGLCIKLLPFQFSGLPDRMVLLPGGFIQFIELKKEKGGTVSDIQKLIHEQFLTLGFKVLIISTYEGVSKFINKYKHSKKCKNY